MTKNISIFLAGLGLLILNNSCVFGQEQQEKKIYNYDQKPIGRTVKKDLKVTAAVFVAEGNLKFKDSLFNLSQDELPQVKEIAVKADININTSQKAAVPVKRKDSELVTGLLTDALRESGKFAIIERQDINAILREAEFSNSKWVNAEQANKIGNIYGVRYIIIANLLKSEAGERVAVGNYALALRLCEVETGEISATGQGEGMTLKEAITNAVKNFSTKVNSQPWSTRIIKVEEGFIYLGAGSNEGLKVKDVLDIYKLKDKIIDPQTNKVLGVDKIKTGTLEIVEILSSDLSKAKMLEPSIELNAADFIVQAKPVPQAGTDEIAKWKKIYGDTSSDKPKGVEATQNPIAASDNSATNMSMSVEGLAQIASPAIVMITTVTNTGGSLGSGFLISSDGTIVTNYHVIKGAEGLSVKFTQDKELTTNVSVIKTDAVRDIALIKVNTPVNVAPLPLGDSEQVTVGERVIAIGNPLGLSNTISDGLISAIRNSNDMKQIQISVPISHGSSGGALINMRGEAIGITSSGMEKGQNLNFAIPINYVKEYLQQ